MAKQSAFKDTSEKINRLASLMFSRKQQKLKPYTVLLGAGASMSSGAPSWPDLCRKIAGDFHATIPRGNDPVHYLTHEVLTNKASPLERYVAVAKYLPDLVPSSGYKHLAQLIASGYINIVFTTNWDSLIESALSGVLSVNHVKTLIRGEVTDDVIVTYLKTNVPRVKIVKMHGDISSQILFMRDDETDNISTSLREMLVAAFEDGLIIVGNQLQDMGVLSAVLTGISKASLYYVNPKTPAASSLTSNLIRRQKTTFITGVEGEHDQFFLKLNLAIQKRECDEAVDQKNAAEKAILLKESRGRGYINYSDISDMVERFASKVLEKSPDLILFIDDPTAPGGMELKKRMLPHFKDANVEIIQICGQGKNRVYNRKVRTPKSQYGQQKKGASPSLIYILDAITFSGNTLRLATEKVKEWYPHATLKTGALVISQHLKDLLSTDHSLYGIVHMHVTDRYEIFFPWGVTQTTGDFDRTFTGLDGSHTVHISKRPWGTIEILAEEQLCSVRLLTLEADEKLSFQRHVCRDELFVALDDDIGLDICAENLTEPFDPYHPDIKSLILEKGDYILIPRGIWHRTKASKARVRLLEVGFGLYDQANDIERLYDNFGRTNKDGSS